MLLITVYHNNRGNQVVAGALNGGNIKTNQLIAGLYLIPQLQLRAKVLAVKVNGINTDMNQQLKAAFAL